MGTQRSRQRALAFAVGLLALPIPALAPALEISSVSAQPLSFDPEAGEATSIRFSLSDPARVALRIFDARGFEVRRIEPAEPLGAGAHQISWDGSGPEGRALPAEAYQYALVATAPSGAQVEWELTDATGGEMLDVQGVRWDPDERTIHFILPERSRARIRIGLQDNGPLLRTLIDWVPRAAGPQTATWDGKDASGVLDLSSHPKLAIFVQAFSLPRNTLLVGPPPLRSEYADLPESAPRRTAVQSASRRMYDYARLPAESRGDFPVRLVLPEELPTDAEGRPIVSAPIAIELGIAPEVARRIQDQRFEAVFYVDGVYAFENEVAFFPLTWRWDPDRLSPGVHFVTVNLRGYEGQFGLATRAVRYRPTGADPRAPVP